MIRERKGSLSEVAAEYVREQILKGVLHQKEKIVENDIAVELGMSRGPVREALKQLKYEGFLDYETNKGYSVSMLSPKDAYEIFYLRGNLENLALNRCGGRLLSDGIFLMEDAVLAMKDAVAADDLPQVIKYDEIFHKQIMISGQMERLTNLWESLSPLNGAMFYTIEQINAYVAEKQLPFDHNDAAARDGRRGNNYLEHKWLLNILKQSNLERSVDAINTHYIGNGERIYRIGMKMENQDLFL
ncbi:GntR family transcriptional regulator [Enterocloster asparagiformis]|uniref:GntR family transcriptional regulator n=1 Tax=Enterocloster asparagiformis TaxID=333367 RepID=UPI0004B897BF|nr:GntR family transcriptional regulator [Enterocloster asparagiformis]